MINKPSREDVLKVVGEPVAFIWETAAETGVQLARPHPNLGVAVVPLYTEARLLAMYAAGAEAMRERAKEACDPRQYPNECDRNIAYKCVAAISTLPITPTNTEGEQG